MPLVILVGWVYCLWGGHLARHINWAGETPSVQGIIEYSYFEISKQMFACSVPLRGSKLRVASCTED